jgi:acyl-CoA reductase-like NAD-dependent aldehyde dehydrogenase
MGPLVSAQQHRRVTAYIEGAKADPHCTLVTGGGRPAAAQGQPGYFVEPTIFEITGDDANATAIWRVSQKG